MMSLSLSSLRLYCSTAPLLCGRPAATEEVRFELTRPLRAYRFSRPAHSTTLPLLLRECAKTLSTMRKSVKFGGRSRLCRMSNNDRKPTDGYPPAFLALPCLLE